MSEQGLASRREADDWIARGWVRVDGRVVAELGARVLDGQRITLDPRARRDQLSRVTVLLHKPLGVVSGQAEDGHQPARTLVVPERHWRGDRSELAFSPAHRQGLVPAGRLDLDSTGLLVLTQDGRIAKTLIGEDSGVEKEYLVRVAPAHGATPLAARTDADLAPLRHGMALDGVALRPAVVERVGPDRLRIVLREGRKRQIRRMCEQLGLAVRELVRVRIGAVHLGDLPLGAWRYLGPDEAFVSGPAPSSTPRAPVR
jgi:23S rRNA pseudouridine2604 synthase